MSVIADISTSADGFIALPDGSAGPIHDWFFCGDESTGDFFRTSGADTQVLHETLDQAGATIAGCVTYDFVDGWGGSHPAGAPVIVVTHHEPATVPQGRTPISFVNDVASAVEHARRIAGPRDVFVMGGASIIGQTLAGGLADYLQLHIAPIAVGSGIRLIDAVSTPITMHIDRVINGHAATHIRYRLK